MNVTGRIERAIASLLDNATRLQGPAVEANVARLRRAHPGENPQQIVDRLERTFLTAVTGSGGAAGAAAAVPGIGTAGAIAAVGAEAAFFLEASALFTLAVASVHGIPIENHERRRALVLAVALGTAGMEIVEKAVGVTRKNWGSLLSGTLPTQTVAGMNQTLLRTFVTKYAARRSALILGKLVPAGIGAAIGGVGNRAIGRGVVENARDAFGPAPAQWAITVEHYPQRV
ncbi:hypothetical protein GCM10023094_20010 [Rhodococcus olei]|uniref:EcsC family protein n=1 Tax=Rhodococcus olei TaxID=2161675 RepID=A0ABP8P147_9NOCA